MLVHTVLKWSKSYNFDLWPFALSHVGYIRNHLPGLDNLSQKRNGVTLCLQLIIIFAVSSHGVVPAMCLTPTFKMVKKSPSGNPVVAKASSLKSPLLALLQYGPDSQPQDQPNYPAVSCPVWQILPHCPKYNLFLSSQSRQNWWVMVHWTGWDGPCASPWWSWHPSSSLAWSWLVYNSAHVPPLRREMVHDSENDHDALVTSSSSPSQFGSVPSSLPGPSTSGSSPVPPPLSSSPTCPGPSNPPGPSPLPSLVHTPVAPIASGVQIHGTLETTSSTLHLKMSIVLILAWLNRCGRLSSNKIFWP